MAVIRVPYPKDPTERTAIHERVVAFLAEHGTCKGTPDAGAFHGQTPVGPISGTYHSPAGSGTLEIILTNKPWLIPTSVFEQELRKALALS